jgi:hypothetical protein
MFRPVAFVTSASHYCPDHKPAPDRDGEPMPIYGWETDGLAGATCDACRAFYVPGDGWLDESASVRWSRCTACNAQRPYARTDYRYARREAWRGRAACDSCGKRGTTCF